MNEMNGDDEFFDDDSEFSDGIDWIGEPFPW